MYYIRQALQPVAIITIPDILDVLSWFGFSFSGKEEKSSLTQAGGRKDNYKMTSGNIGMVLQRINQRRINQRR